MFISLIAVCLVLCLNQKSFKQFFKILWKYSSVLLSECNSFTISKGFIEKLIATLWLMSCFILMSAFAGQLWQLLVRSQPIYQIESWNDLYSKPEWKDLKIQTYKELDMYNFAKDPQNANNPMAQDFNKRFVNLLNPLDYLFGGKNFDKDIDYKGLMEGRLVQVHNRDFLQVIKKNIIEMGYREDIDFHISQYGSGTQPVFLASNPKIMNETLGKAFDYT